MNSYNALRELVLARTREFFREPEAVFWVYVFPLLLMIGLGIAFREGSGEHEESRVRIAADDPSRLATLADALRAAGGFTVETSDAASLEATTSKNPPDVLVLALADKIVFTLDPARAEARLARLRASEVLESALGRQDPMPQEVVTIEQRGKRYIDWLVPGLVGMNVMGGGIYGVGFVIVDMRMRKLLRRLLATPMRRGHFLLAIVGSRLIFFLPEIAGILIAGVLIFGMPIAGSLVSVLVIVLAGVLSFSGVGLLVASRARKIETVSGLMNLVMLPMWLLSGIFFSADRFPAEVQPFIQALPLTQLNNALRAVILDGASLGSQWASIAGLAIWGGVSFPLALRLFRWE